MFLIFSNYNTKYSCKNDFKSLAKRIYFYAFKTISQSSEVEVHWGLLYLILFYSFSLHCLAYRLVH